MKNDNRATLFFMGNGKKIYVKFKHHHAHLFKRSNKLRTQEKRKYLNCTCRSQRRQTKSGRKEQDKFFFEMRIMIEHDDHVTKLTNVLRHI